MILEAWPSDLPSTITVTQFLCSFYKLFNTYLPSICCMFTEVVQKASNQAHDKVINQWKIETSSQKSHLVRSRVFYPIFHPNLHYTAIWSSPWASTQLLKSCFQNCMTFLYLWKSRSTCKSVTRLSCCMMLPASVPTRSARLSIKITSSWNGFVIFVCSAMISIIDLIIRY